MSIIQALQNQYSRDLARQKSKILSDKNDVQYSFDEKRQVFLGLDKTGQEWIRGPDTEVPCYWEYCPNKIQHVIKGALKIKKCNKPHFVPIFQDGTSMKCVECGHEHTITINLPDNYAPQKELLNKIRAEK